MTGSNLHAAMFHLLDQELVEATGCTEPAAVAYAAASARTLVVGEVDRIEIEASVNIIKNAMAAGIPGTKLAGMEYAAVLGALLGDAKRKLQVLCGLGPSAESVARDFVRAGRVHVVQSDNPKKLFINVVVRAKDSWGRAVIEDRHDGITLLENADGAQFSTVSLELPEESDGGQPNISIEDIIEFVENVDIAKLDIIRRALDLNRAISSEGLEFGHGLGVGKMIKEYISDGVLSDDMLSHAMARTAAGTDARMAGSERSVMSNSGSGNQGLSATLPVVAVWEKLNLPEEKLIRAATLSNLVTIFAKFEFGKLSALCGVVLAASGAACGISWLLGASRQRVKLAVHNVVGNVAGMICDGAKSDCALKVSTCTAAAVQASLLAVKGKAAPPVDGIVGLRAEDSIGNLAKLGNGASPTLDPLIIDIMLSKPEKQRPVDIP